MELNDIDNCTHGLLGLFKYYLDKLCTTNICLFLWSSMVDIFMNVVWNCTYVVKSCMYIYYYGCV